MISRKEASVRKPILALAEETCNTEMGDALLAEADVSLSGLQGSGIDGGPQTQTP